MCRSGFALRNSAVKFTAAIWHGYLQVVLVGEIFTLSKLKHCTGSAQQSADWFGAFVQDSRNRQSVGCLNTPQTVRGSLGTAFYDAESASRARVPGARNHTQAGTGAFGGCCSDAAWQHAVYGEI